MYCGCPVVSLSSAVHSSIPEECRAVDASSIAESVSYLSGLSGEEYNALSNSLRSDICTKHSLSSLIKRLVEEMA